MAVVASTGDGGLWEGQIHNANNQNEGHRLSRALTITRTDILKGGLLSHSPLPNKTTMSVPDGALPYSQRPEWQDIIPVPQHESLNPLAPIFYTDECTALSTHTKMPDLLSIPPRRQGLHGLFPWDSQDRGNE